MTVTNLGISLLAALALWLIGGWFIGITGKLIRRTLNRRLRNPALCNYLNDTARITLHLLLLIAILLFLSRM